MNTYNLMLSMALISFASASAAVIEVTNINDFNNAINNNGIVVVKFSRPSCPACQVVKATFENISNALGVLFLNVNTDVLGSLVSQYSIKGLPTIAYFNRGVEDKFLRHMGTGAFETQIRNNVTTLKSKPKA